MKAPSQCGHWHAVVDGVLEGRESACCAWAVRIVVSLLYLAAAGVAGMTLYLFYVREVGGLDAVQSLQPLFVAGLLGHLMRWHRVEGLDPRFRRVFFALMVFLALCVAGSGYRVHCPFLQHFHLWDVCAADGVNGGTPVPAWSPGPSDNLTDALSVAEGV
eukprot:TRINITY_DN5769_c0_g1_i1.p2 TRINITY_DN5769_c0_g1~~TRINITY_DN5769_c0_g1_i1.p2  ORF type:complete len:160 (+),score=46.84 TRINITY_DN5769_c0_g1_i1:182-661(+)